MSGIWQLKINTAFDSQSEQYSLGVLNNPLIAIKVTSSSALPSWRKGGSISQSLIVDGNKTAFTAQRELILNKLSIYEFPLPAAAEYELTYFPLLRLSQVNIEVWEYTGEVENQVAEQIIAALASQVTIQAQLDSNSSSQILTLTEKIDELMALCGSSSTPELPDNLVYKTNGKILPADLPDELVYQNEFTSLLPSNLVYTNTFASLLPSNLVYTISGKINNSLLSLQEYTSSPITLTVSSTVNLTIPFVLTKKAVIQYFLLNKTASAGYVVGDLVEPIMGGNSATITSHFAENGTQLNVSFGTVLPVVRRLDNWLTVSVSPTNWDLIVGVRQWS